MHYYRGGNMLLMSKITLNLVKQALLCNLILLNRSCTFGKWPVYDDFCEDNIVVVLLLPSHNFDFHSVKKIF
jgi:hypothetical protein